jgi:hypothetical protein
MKIGKKAKYWNLKNYRRTKGGRYLYCRHIEQTWRRRAILWCPKRWYACRTDGFR